MRRPVRPRGLKLKYIKTVTKPNGKRFIYYSEPGKPRVRLPDLPHNSAKFLKAYVAAQQEALTSPRKIRARTGSIAAAIEAYLSSDSFMANRASTRDTKRRRLDALRKDYGDAKMSDLRARHIQADITKLPGHAANNRLRAWRALCLWSVDAGLIAENVSLAVSKRPVPKSEGHTPWAEDEISTYRKFYHIGSSERLAFEVIYWTGARSGDAVGLSQGMVDQEGWLTYLQSKTGGQVSIPWGRDLPEWADPIQTDLAQLHAALDARGDKHLTFITTTHGKARSVKSFSQWFSKAASNAGLPEGRSAHGLRKSRAVKLAELGATTHQIAAWTGHETLSEVERYSRKADRKRLLTRTDQKQKLETDPKQFPKSVASD